MLSILQLLARNPDKAAALGKTLPTYEMALQEAVATREQTEGQFGAANHGSEHELVRRQRLARWRQRAGRRRRQSFCLLFIWLWLFVTTF